MKTLTFFRMGLLSASLMLVQATTSAQVVTTLAGSGQTGSGDGNGAQASFASPLGVAVDLSGNVYVADGSLRIRKITPSGLVTTVAGDGNAGYDDGTKARFWGPLGVAADVSGNVWVADSDDGFDGAYIKQITPDGVVHNLVLYPGFDPLAVALDKSGNLYVLDHDSGLWKVAAGGRSASLVSLIRGRGVAVDGEGNAYIADRDNNKILKITPAGTVTTLAGSGDTGSKDGPGAAASFRGPTGLAVDSSGTVYVADRGNHTIRQITTAGIVTTLAGSGKPGSAEGTGTAASFNSPAGVALDSSGNLYVADSGNNRIRKIALAGGPVDVAATSDGGTGYLIVTGANRIVLGTVDASGRRREQSYGPYEGWSPRALATGLDGLTRVLWTNGDGRSVAWLVGPDGVLGSFVFGAESERTAKDIAGGPDGQSRVLLTGPSGASLRTIDARGNTLGSIELGFYPGWTATAISDGPDGLTRLLWNSSDGRTGISRVSLAGIVATDRYAAVAGWTSVDVAAGGDGRTRILRADNSGRITLWITNDSGTISTSGPIYDPPPGLTPQRLSSGRDGTSRVLWTGVGSAAVVWVLSPEGVLQASFGLD